MNTEPGSALADAIKERDGYFSEAARMKETLAEIIPALERASGLKADDFRKLTRCALTGDEIAALWMARAILEAPNDKLTDRNAI